MKSQLEQKKQSLTPKEMKGMRVQQAIDSRDIVEIEGKKRVKTSLPVVNRADEIWSGLDEGKKKRLLNVFRSIKGEKEREALVKSSIGDVYRAVDNRDIEIDDMPGLSGLAVDAGDIRDFSKMLGRYGKRGDYGKWPLKGNES